MPGKTKTSAYFYTLRFFGGRGWMSRAAHLKKPRRGFFARRTIRRADAVRIHPPGEFSLVAKQKTSVISTLVFLVGAGGFEPPKLKSSRFTVCPHWPLGNTPRFCSRPLPDDLFILSDCGRFVNYFFRIFAAFLRKLSAGSVLGQMFPALVIPQGGNGFAGHGV